MNRSDLDERDQKTLWVSWSRLQTWEKCQQKAVLQMERKTSTIKEGRNFVSGTVADRAMRQWLEQEPGTHEAGQMSQIVDDIWETHTKDSTEYKVTFKSPTDQNNAKELAREAVNALEPFLFARVLPFDYQPEWRFTLAVKIPDIFEGAQRTIVLNGGADIIVHEPETDSWSIYDLKTTRNENYVLGSTMAQLIYYQIALNIATGARFDRMHSAFLTPATKVQYHPLEITDDDRRLLMSRIVKFSQSVWRKDVPTLTKNENDCYFCDCKLACPRFATPSKTIAGKHVVSFADAAALRKSAKEKSA